MQGHVCIFENLCESLYVGDLLYYMWEKKGFFLFFFFFLQQMSFYYVSCLNFKSTDNLVHGGMIIKVSLHKKLKFGKWVVVVGGYFVF